MQKAAENRHHPEKFRDPLRLKLNFNFLLDHITELFVLGERMSRVAADKFGVVGKEPRLDSIFQGQLINRIPALNYKYPD